MGQINSIFGYLEVFLCLFRTFLSSESQLGVNKTLEVVCSSEKETHMVPTEAFKCGL
jgi:hypothetical protein